MPLTDAERQHLERRLIEERRRVADDLERYAGETRETMQEASGDLSRYPTHHADEGTDTFDQELGASNASRQSRELENIDDALDRLRRTPERYGRDERTGEDIPFARLDVIPWARTREGDAGSR